MEKTGEKLGKVGGGGPPTCKVDLREGKSGGEYVGWSILDAM